MKLRRILTAAVAAAAWSAIANAQWKLPANPHALPANLGPSPAPAQPNAVAATVGPQILWIRNDKTGQVIRPKPRQLQAGAAGDPPPPVSVYDNFSHSGGISSINLNWNYPDAYSDPDFATPVGGDPLNFAALNISSDPTDPDDHFLVVNNEKLSLLLEPWTATNWPDADLNVPQPIKDYSSVFASYSQQLEVRVCRVYMFALLDVNQPFDSVLNPYALDLQLSFAFVSFPFQYLATPVTFDLEGFDPALTTKGKGLILTHWMQLTVPPPCPADLNGDTLVDDADFSLFIVQYDVLDCADETMPNFCSADLNGDALVDDADFSIFIVAYNTLLCPEATVVRKVYAPLAGGRQRWDPDNLPWLDPASEALPVSPWPYPNSLLTVPTAASAGTHFGEEPSFNFYLTTLTGYHYLDVAPLQENAPIENLKTEYERFLNACVTETVNGNPALQQYSVFDVKSFVEGGLENTDWLPSSTPKLIRLMPPTATK